MQLNEEKSLQRRSVCWPTLPLAVYREVMAHLRQIEGVNVGLLPWPANQPFDYQNSQVQGLWIEYSSSLNLIDLERLELILSYYQKHFD